MKRKSLLIPLILILVGALFAPLTACSMSTARLSEATMATSVDAITGEPLDSIDTFDADIPEIYASVKLSNAPDDTEVSSEWIYVSGEADMDNYSIITLSDQFAGTQYIYFIVSRPDPVWPSGNYKVVISLDGEEQLTLPFTVNPPAIPLKPENLLTTDAEYKDLWETFDSWGLDFYDLFTTTSEQGIEQDWDMMWLGDSDEGRWVYFKRVDNSWEPYYRPPQPDNLLASDAEYQELWETFTRWVMDFNALFTTTSEQGLAEGWFSMWIGSTTDESRRAYFRRIGDVWEPYDPAVIPPQPDNLLASETEYHELWETFNNAGVDFYSLFVNSAQQGITEGWITMWLSYTDDESQRVYFNRVGDDWDLDRAQEMTVIMPARDYTRVTANFTNTLEAGDVIEGTIEISGEYKTQDWSFDWTGEVIGPDGDTIDIFRGHWLHETVYELNVEVPTDGEYTIRVRHNSKFEKELYINIKPSGWSY